YRAKIVIDILLDAKCIMVDGDALPDKVQFMITNLSTQCERIGYRVERATKSLVDAQQRPVAIADVWLCIIPRCGRHV
ncbi:MAG: hypothetical protein ABIR55_04985, partial [Burkholderiaceae bacterium]